MSILRKHWNLFFQKENTNLSLIYQHSFQRKTEMVRKTCFSPFLQQIERDIHSHTGWHYWVVPQVLTDQWSAGWCVEHRKRRRSHLASVWRRWNTSNYCCVCWTICTIYSTSSTYNVYVIYVHFSSGEYCSISFALHMYSSSIHVAIYFIPSHDPNTARWGTVNAWCCVFWWWSLDSVWHLHAWQTLLLGYRQD